MADPLKEKVEKLLSKGEQIQKYINHHQNKLAQYKTQLLKPEADTESIETSVDKLTSLYEDVTSRFSKDFVELKYSFVPNNLTIPYSVKYVGGTSPLDITLCHNTKFLLKGVRMALKKKIFANQLPRYTGTKEHDCVIAVDMKRTVVRGVVMSVSSGQVITLLDIDTGDLKMATVENIYELDDEAVSFHALCMRCSLEGDLTDLNKYWTMDLSYYFVSALKYGELICVPGHGIIVDDSTFPPRCKVSLEVMMNSRVVLQINDWVSGQLLPALKKESENCLDINKVIRGLPSTLLMPYVPTATDYTHLESSANSNVNSSVIISSSESSVLSSSSSDDFSVDIKIDPISFQSMSAPVENLPTPYKEDIDVYFTNSHMISPSNDSLEDRRNSKCDSLEERRNSKCDCGEDCSALISFGTPSELLQSHPKVPRLTTVIPSLARIPNGEPFYYTMKNKSKSLLPTPNNQISAGGNKSDTETRSGDSFFNNFFERKMPLLATPSLLSHPTCNHNGHPTCNGHGHPSCNGHSSCNGGLTGGSCPVIHRPWSPKVNPQGILVPIRDVTTRLNKWSNALKHRSDNSLASGGSLSSSFVPNGTTYNPSVRRPLPKSHLYTNPLMPSYMEDSYDISGDTQYGGGAYVDNKSLASGPNSRGEGISLKEEHFCQAEHLEKVSSVKLPGVVLLVEPGQERKALISFVESPGKFYVNILESNTGHMEELENAMCKHYSSVTNLVSLVNIEEARHHLGDYVAAKWKSDNRWYRARVLDWTSAKKSIAILFVDHGNVDSVPLDYIQPLMPTFAHHAPMAQPCHLANVAPASSTNWNEEAIDMFSKFCKTDSIDIYSLTFQPSSSNDSCSSWSVIIRNSSGECINDLLVAAGLATNTKLNGHNHALPSSHSSEKLHVSDHKSNPSDLKPDSYEFKPNASNHKTVSSHLKHQAPDFKPHATSKTQPDHSALSSDSTLASLPTSSVADKEEERRAFFRKQIARNKKRNATLLQRIKRDVREDAKVLVLLRGLPGSGKSTRAEDLVATFRAMGSQPAVYSADKYFMTPNGYQYDAKKISLAHNWVYKSTEDALKAFQSPLIIDNTNTEEFEILNYYNLAYHNWYKVYVLEPDTPWAFDVVELAKKNTHNVPLDKLNKMLKRYCWPRKQKWAVGETPGSVSGDSVDSCVERLHDTSIG